MAGTPKDDVPLQGILFLKYKAAVYFKVWRYIYTGLEKYYSWYYEDIYLKLKV